MINKNEKKLADILLVEDNDGDILLTQEAFEEAKFNNKLHVVEDGDKALDFLYQRHAYAQASAPDLILLDLNIPKTDGRAICKIIMSDEKLKKIPVVILTSSTADRDIIESYNLHTSRYIVKPVDAHKFIDVVRSIEHFSIEVLCLPLNNKDAGLINA